MSGIGVSRTIHTSKRSLGESPSSNHGQPGLRFVLSAFILSATVFRDTSSSAFATPTRFSPRHRRHGTETRTRIKVDRRCRSSSLDALSSRCKRRRGLGFVWQPKSPQTAIPSLRAGASSVSRTHQFGGEDDNNQKRIEEARLQQRRERKVSIALAAAYFSVMGAKCALPAVLPLLLSPTIGLTFPPNTEPQHLFARQLTVATLAVALGKLCLGPVIDHLGGSLALRIALLCLTLLLGTISLSQTFVVFTCCWVLVDFCFSSCWAACLNAIHENFEEERWGREIGNLATAARAGNSVAFAAFAWVLSIFQQRNWMRQYWRPVFMTATLAQIIPLIMLSAASRSAPRKPAVKQPATAKEKPSVGTSLRLLQHESQRVDFWLHLVSRSALMLFASFLLFVPTFMTSAFYLSSAGGAQVGSLYALGCLISVSTISNLYPKLSRKSKCWAIVGFLLVGATGSSFSILGHVLSWWNLPPLVCALLFLLWGFSFSVPFYLPPSIYALSRGGEECSATIADAFDVGGFALLAVFNGYVAGIQHTNLSSWAPTFAIMTACSLTSFVSLFAATYRETKDGESSHG